MRLPFLLLVLASLPLSAHAQHPLPDVQITPRLGYYASDKGLAQIESGGDLVHLRSAPAVGLDVQFAWRSLPWVSLRVGADRTVGADLALHVFQGWESCGRRCSSAQYRYENLGAHGSLLAGAADLVLKPAPSDWIVRPYLYVGTGYRRYDFEADRLSGTAARLFAHDKTRQTRHLGLGADFDLMGPALRLDVGSYSGNYAGPDASLADGYTAPTGLKHDLVVSLGIRLSPFGR